MIQQARDLAAHPLCHYDERTLRAIIAGLLEHIDTRRVAMREYKLMEPLKYVGCWQIGGATGLSISLTKRPRWLTQVLMRWLVEWEWVDWEMK